VDDARCDPKAMAGVYPAKLKGKNDFKDLHKVPCTKEPEECIAADQIFPLMKAEHWYTPTIKHHCPRVALASSLRACSNKVSFDPTTFKKFSKWFDSYIDKFMKYLDEDLWNCDVQDWLTKFPLAYRKKLMKAFDPNNITSKGKMDCNYEAFTKVELQFTTVMHDDKNTPLNDSKERQICGPTDEKKMWANAFINMLEGVASKHMKSYCGRANWIDICKGLDDIEQQFNDPYWGASDGSGFDMTQFPECNALMNKLILRAARHPNVTIPEPLDYERLKEALEGSLTLKVGIDHGDLKYEAVGRASGDGWTTFGNTMLMIAYWQFTFEMAAIPYALKVKGDDVLFCIERKHQDVVKMYVGRYFTTGKHEHSHGLGQICKKIDFGPIENLDFLSNEFFRTSQGKIRMTRIPARVFQTNSWTTKLPKNIMSLKVDLDIRKQLCYSKGMCLKAWAEGLPVFGVLAEKMIELGKEGKHNVYDKYADADRVWHKGRDDWDNYLLYLDERYNVTQEEVKLLEDSIRSIKSLDGALYLPMLEKFYHPNPK
jgi:hypothetical protein